MVNTGEIMKKIKYIDSFTFLRAVFIIAISFFHTSPHLFKGGFIAVDSFFILSGFLMMGKLESLKEEEFKAYGKYIIKRLRSLLPALYFVLTSSLVLALIFSRPIFFDSIKSSLPSALSFQNIYQILDGGSYFKQNGYFSMFTHFWYISMQIQFVLIFTLVNFFIRKLKRRDKLAIFSFISLISMVIMINYSYSKDNISRIYYGTDARIFTFFIGAIVYLLKDKFIKLASIFKDKEKDKYFILGPILIVSLIAYVLVDGNSLTTYRIIIEAYAILQALLVGILFAFEKTNILAINKRDFGIFKTLIYYIGLRSYYIYLWQYIINTFISYYLKSSKLNIIYFNILQVIIVLILAEITYQIFRKKNSKKSFLLISLLILSILNVMAIFMDNPKERDLKKLEESLSRNKKQINEENKNYKKKKDRIDSNDSPLDKDDENMLKAKAYDDFNFTDYEKKFLNDKSVTAIGDSVLINIDKYLREFNPNLYLDGEVGRDMKEGVDILQSIKNNTGLGDIVLIGLGSNGPIEYQSLLDIRKICEGKKLFFVNTVDTQAWEESVNEDLEKFCQENDNTYIIDWYKYAKQRPDLFAKDFVHPNIDGSIAYRNLVERAILNAYSE